MCLLFVCRVCPISSWYTNFQTKNTFIKKRSFTMRIQKVFEYLN